MKELDIQRFLYQSLREDGGFGMKMSSQLYAGIPDLLLQHRKVGTWLVEIKYIPDLAWEALRIPIKTTVLQKHTLQEFQDAGGKSAVIVVGRDKPNNCYHLLYTKDIGMGHFNRGWEQHMSKHIGNKWPILAILEDLNDATS